MIFDLGLRRHVLGEILVGQEDDAVGAQRLSTTCTAFEEVQQMSHLRLHFGRGVDVGDDRHAGIALAQQRARRRR